MLAILAAAASTDPVATSAVQTIVLFIAALVGSALKAWVTSTQATLSKKSIADIVIGACVGGFFPLIVNSLPAPVSSLFAKATLLEQGMLLTVFAYISSDFVNNVLTKIGWGFSGESLRTPSK